MKKKILARASILSGCLLLPGCMSVQLVSNYDNQTDEAATAMQKDVTTFFVKLRSPADSNDTTFSANQEFYKKQAINISAMKLRASAIPKNSLTSRQIQELEVHLAYLALLHKRCVNSALTPAQISAVNSTGLDTSSTCRTAYGAETNLDNRGGQSPNMALAGNVEGQINFVIRAIIQFEIAKKRGEKSTEEK